MGDVRRILPDVKRGERLAAGQLLPPVYDELREPATVRLAREDPGAADAQTEH